MDDFVINHASPVTPSDTLPLTAVSDFLSFTNTGGSQTLRALFVGDTTPVTITGLASGMYPLRVRQVFNTGTSVGNIMSYWT
jgi:hypothetical protein